MKVLKLVFIANLLLHAGSLEDALKSVEVSGTSRYRYENIQSGDKTHDSYHRFTLDINFKATISDDFFGVIGVRYDK